MSATQVSSDAAGGASPATGMAMRFEVAVLPVSDVDRSKAFYEGLGWRVDADVAAGDYHLVQLTPPGSDASIIFGRGVTTAEPGSIDRLLLAVDDIDATREAMRSRGVDVSETFHHAGGSLGGGFFISDDQRAAGPDPEGRSYATYASFSDPDGNRWLLQEITDRIPGRVDTTTKIEELSALLLDAAQHHDAYEKASPPHDWWDWYAAYMDARGRGSAPDDAVPAADRYMAEVKGVVASR